MSRKVGFVGGGNMAEGIIGGLVAAGTFPGAEIYVKEILPQRAQYLKDRYGVTIVDSYKDIAEAADIIVLAVRPQDAEPVSRDLGAVLADDKIIVSICAGILIDKIASWVGGSKKYARIMPNTMIESGRGYSALAFGDGFTDEEKADVQIITDSIGKTLPLAESKFDAFTASSCAGPEWVILFAQALIDAAVESGLSRSDAQAIIHENLIATGTVLDMTERHPFKITDEMNTPGGIGIAGLHSFQRSGFSGIVMDAVMAAYKRTTELG